MRGADLGASRQGVAVGGVGETSLSSPNLQGSNPPNLPNSSPCILLPWPRLRMQPHFATIRRRAGRDT